MVKEQYDRREAERTEVPLGPKVAEPTRCSEGVPQRATRTLRVVRVGTGESEGQLLVSDLYVKSGGAVLGEHVHPAIEESFTVIRGRVGFPIDGRESIAELDQRLHVPAGTAHDWWNAGEEEAHVIVEISPAQRFEEAIVNSFGLAQDGETNSKGMPNLLQLVLFAREFEDVLYFTTPPRTVQKILFGVLAPIARALGYRGSYPRYISLLSEGQEGAGPPSTTRIMMRTVALASSLLVASLLVRQACRLTGKG